MANNVWVMTAKDKDGKPVESAPGLFKFVLRGPERIETVKLHAQYLLNSMRQRVFDNTGIDPVYMVDTFEPAGSSDQAVEQVGDWRPRGAEPVNLPLPKSDE